jgi:hypothetical protein
MYGWYCFLVPADHDWTMMAVTSFEVPLCWNLCQRLCKPLDVGDVAADEDPHCGAVSAVSLIEEE